MNIEFVRLDRAHHHKFLKNTRTTQRDDSESGWGGSECNTVTGARILGDQMTANSAEKFSGILPVPRTHRKHKKLSRTTFFTVSLGNAFSNATVNCRFRISNKNTTPTRPSVDSVITHEMFRIFMITNVNVL